MKYIFVLLSMIFCHIVDDYYLQGILASLKQKEWWKKNAPQKLYRYDYVVALFMHSFSWSFMIMLPIAVYSLFTGMKFSAVYIIPYFSNMAIHAIIDDLKANKKMINLIQDQLLHLLQIVTAWLIFLSCSY